MDIRKNIRPILVLLVLVLIPPGPGLTAQSDNAGAEPQETELQVEKISLEESERQENLSSKYPPVLSPAGEAALKVEFKENIGTVIGRFYLYQKQDEKGG
ncbi:MAG: hypothetical protein ACYS3S_21130, partial [Planctomycetota bacterium]